MPFSRARKRIRRDCREQRALLALAAARRTLKIKRDNIDRVVFYTEHKIAFNRIAKSGNSSVILYLMKDTWNQQPDDYKQAKRAAMNKAKISSQCPDQNAIGPA